MKMYSSFFFKHCFFYIATTPIFHDKNLPEKLSKRSQCTVISLGLDSGSSMTKAVLLEDTRIIDTKMIPTSISPRKSLEDLYREYKTT